MSDSEDTKRTPEQVKAEIRQTQEQLGETVEALAAKTDVKGQAKQAVGDARTTVNEKVSGLKESVSTRAGNLTDSAQQTAPRSVSDAGAQASQLVRENRPAAIAVGALILGILIGRRGS